MEVIRFDGYTTDEKVAIARGYLWPRQRERNGLREDEVSVSDVVLETVISDYTREAGVRQLERELGKLLRKTATGIASEKVEAPVELTIEQVRDALGRQKFFREAAERTAVPGVATGLAVTGTGGDVLFVEATSAKGDKLVLTGQLGDVMKESAQIALSALRARAAELGVDEEAFERAFHLHVPAGAIPKDGPSAGITMATALASLLSGRPVKHTVGMTGEVTLQGRVLPIGGLKQKVLAAHAAGLTDVILPERNRQDLDDVPDARPRGDDVPSGDVARRGAGAGARAGDPAPCGVGPAGPFPRRSAARRASSSGAGSSRCSGRPTKARPASTSSSRRSGRSRRGTLAQRLVELEEAGVLERRVIDARPPRVEYRLTAEGRRLKLVVDAVAAFADR